MSVGRSSASILEFRQNATELRTLCAVVRFQLLWLSSPCQWPKMYGFVLTVGVSD